MSRMLNAYLKIFANMKDWNVLKKLKMKFSTSCSNASCVRCCLNRLSVEPWILISRTLFSPPALPSKTIIIIIALVCPCLWVLAALTAWTTFSLPVCLHVVTSLLLLLQPNTELVSLRDVRPPTEGCVLFKGPQSTRRSFHLEHQPSDFNRKKFWLC